jgi:HlyD family secretion protein
MPLSRKILAAGALAVGAAALVWALKSPETRTDAKASTAATRAAPRVTVVPAKTTTMTDTIIVNGTLVARDEVLVVARNEGQAIEHVLVEEGDQVKEGQVLAKLVRDRLQAAIAQNDAQQARAEASLAAAKSQIAEADAARVQAQASFQRTRTLRDDGFASAETFDQRQATARQTTARLSAAKEQQRLAEADIQLAEAQRKDLDIQMERADIKAPAGGIVSRKTAKLGAVASAAGDPLFRIIRDGLIELEAEVAETVLARLKPGMKVVIRPAGSETDVEGTIRLVSPEISRTSRLGRIRVVPAASSNLMLGAYARGVVEMVRREGIAVPLSAVQFTQDGARLQVIAEGVVKTREVSVGIRAGSLVEIQKGLAAGEQVVSIAGAFLRDGDRVTPIKEQ